VSDLIIPDAITKLRLPVSGEAEIMLVQLLIALAALCTLSYSYESPSSECLSVENGSLIGYIMPTFIALNISNVLELSCICETIGIDGIEAQSFRGVTGALLHGDCGALRYFAKVAKQQTSC
jgi:hypothetical protein